MLNPEKHGFMYGYENGNKLLRTITSPMTKQQIAAHLIGSNDARELTSGIRRYGWLSSDITGMYTQVGVIDIDAHTHEDFLELSTKLMAVESSIRKNLGEDVPFYKERTLNLGWHVYFFLDTPISFELMNSALYQIKSDALLHDLETYPMGSKGAQGRWVFHPGYGALSPFIDPDFGGDTLETLHQLTGVKSFITHGYGRTYLETHLDEPVSVFDYARIKRIEASRFEALGRTGKETKIRELSPKKIGKDSYDPAAIDLASTDSNMSLFRDNVIRRIPTRGFQRHDSLMCWMNLGRRMDRLEECVAILESPSVYESWVRDGSRTYDQWKSEVSRMAEKFEIYGTDEYGFEYGIKKLLDLGWHVEDFGKLAKDSAFESDKNQSKATLAKRFIEHLASKNRNLIYFFQGDYFRQYNGRFYYVMNERFLLQQLRDWYDEVFGPGKASVATSKLILEEMKVAMSREQELEEDPELIVTPSCVLRLKKWTDSDGKKRAELERLPHSPDHITFSMVYADYDEEVGKNYQNSAIFKTLLNSFWIDGPQVAFDKVFTMLQFSGYCFFAERKIQKMLYLHGQTGSGKSTLIKLITRCMQQTAEDAPERLKIAREDQSMLSPMQFLQMGNDHMYQSIEGKRCLVISEIQSTGHGVRPAMVMLKALISGDSINVNPKGKSPYPYTPSVKVIISGNTELSYGEDRTNDSITRRLIRIDIEAGVRKEDLINENELNDMLWGTQERLNHNFSAMLYLALEMIRDDYTFRHYDSVTVAEEVAEHMNPFITFVKEALVPAAAYGDSIDELQYATGIIKLNDLRLYYNAWAIKEGQAPIDSVKYFPPAIRHALNSLGWYKYCVKLVKVDYMYLVGVYVKPQEELTYNSRLALDEVARELAQSVTKEELLKRSAMYAKTVKGKRDHVKRLTKQDLKFIELKDPDGKPVNGDVGDRLS